MSRKVNNTLVGLFVLLGISLIVVCVMLFGSSAFSMRKTEFICFFEDSVNGLESGARVKFKGVTIGEVHRVLLRVPGQAADDNAIPVLLKIDGDRPGTRDFVAYLSNPDNQQAMRESGLRARLQSQSLLTGLLYVELDIHPGTPAKYHQSDAAGGLPEIPTLASDFGALVRALTRTTEQLSKIRFSEMGEKADRILGQVENGVAAMDFKALNKRLLDLAESANGILNAPETRSLAGNLNATLESTRKLAEKFTPLAPELSQTCATARDTLSQLNHLAESLRAHAAPGAALPAQMDETLRQISAAAEAVRSLAAYLERRPETLLRGKADL
ncbi:MAG: MlaD family protein [Puniceicoccales bacterium]|jgi:paraquat-inducible protein B|nr:MlaD family protein [Puniceicoccales bacterium]